MMKKKTYTYIDEEIIYKNLTPDQLTALVEKINSFYCIKADTKKVKAVLKNILSTLFFDEYGIEIQGEEKVKHFIENYTISSLVRTVQENMNKKYRTKFTDEEFKALVKTAKFSFYNHPAEKETKREQVWNYIRYFYRLDDNKIDEILERKEIKELL